ncbi:MAG: hypothetical protein OXI87_14390 [Albidovulum sp.]|nr:hypothetical protein [Albidovulum sp.]MDE0532587.1 hypothetical protein [Albidovulum sp.]
MIPEPVFEADFQDGSNGCRPKRTAYRAVQKVATTMAETKTTVIGVDLEPYFDTVGREILLGQARRPG